MNSSQIKEKIEKLVDALDVNSYGEGIEDCLVHLRCYDRITIELSGEDGTNREVIFKNLIKEFISNKDGTCGIAEEISWLKNCASELQSCILLLEKQIVKLNNL